MWVFNSPYGRSNRFLPSNAKALCILVHICFRRFYSLPAIESKGQHNGCATRLSGVPIALGLLQPMVKVLFFSPPFWRSYSLREIKGKVHHMVVHPSIHMFLYPSGEQRQSTTYFLLYPGFGRSYSLREIKCKGQHMVVHSCSLVFLMPSGVHHTYWHDLLYTTRGVYRSLWEDTMPLCEQLSHMYGQLAHTT